MSHDLGVLLTRQVPLEDVLTGTTDIVSRIGLEAKLEVSTVEGDLLSDVFIGPFNLNPDRQGSFALWERATIDISAGPNSSIGLSVGHMRSDQERGLSDAHLSETERVERQGRAGYRAVIEIGRTPESILLGTLLACSLGVLSGTRVIDDEGLLGFGAELLEPSTILSAVGRVAGAHSLADFARRFCLDRGVRLHQ